MAKKKPATRKKPNTRSTKTNTKKGKKSFFRSIVNFLKSDIGSFVIGICILFVAIYILIGMISFFFTGAEDQSKIINKSFTELIGNKLGIKNWTGTTGAFVSEQLINKFMGIFSLLIPVYIALIGLRLMRVWKCSLIRTFLIFSFVLIWGSITFSFLQSAIYPNPEDNTSFIRWGGSHGSTIVNSMESAFGKPGMILIVILLFVIFILITKKASVEFFRNIFQKPLQLATKKNDNEPETIEENEENEEEDKPSFFQRIFALIKHGKEEDEEEDDVIPFNNATEEPSPVVDFSIDIPSTPPPSRTKPAPAKPALSIEDDFEVVVPQIEETYIAPQPTTTTPPQPTVDREPEPQQTDPESWEEEVEMEDYDPTKDLSSYKSPSLDLLKVYDTSGHGVDMEEQRANKEKIIKTLKDYGIEITSIKATVGPTITLYEIVPQAGVRISKIRNLEDDIALSLAALGIRIIAPMPGKGTIGIEVPNKDPQIVSMQSVIASKRFQESTLDLPVALGKTITNEIFMFDLCKMPHLLVAGATGQGKSVGLNAIITSLLYKKHPAEMKMVLVDPKMVEFNIYSTIEKHYLAKLPDAEKAIITDVTKVTQTLNSLTKEMDDRYELLMGASVRTIKEYNEKFIKRRLSPVKGHRYLPYIVVVIDEFGDLIMTAGKEIELPIARIAQKARAVGIHMIIATQRPTTNIITGTIKANFPARMAFRVTSQIDSRTILDMAGANQLIGRGDMLFSQGSDLVRVQCAFVDTPEVEGIAQYIGSQQGYSHAFELPEFVTDAGDDKAGSVDLNDKDPLFDEAARLIVIHQQGSTSLIQRKFSIGYNRAGRLMDQLEAAGVVGPTQGSKPREVYIGDEYSLEQKLNSMKGL
ncbi:DNA translocase FtsK [Dysgonomonas sp. 520]|uniref:FtsK/SpoIIIE family DNA translocase n=1 Tax=Dysgonomonas sp. 520 TaxID=2302931 RepID=UPI0013D8B1D9|nr:DNA translocase FtsK [Dysgonomonas sp. 520]NDW08820.1 DNA translocase FtsK [Dysgonomonas sp. 520]